MRPFPAAVGCLVLSVGLLFGDENPRGNDPALPSAAQRDVDFRRDVQPIRARACVACHGAAKQRGGLRLDDGAAALKGGNTGAVIVPGQAGKSRLLLLVAGLNAELKMPPEGKPPLSAEEVGLLRAWIEQGAKW